MELPDFGKISVDEVPQSFLENRKVKLDVLRLDRIHRVISGNKWFKLKYHLENFSAGKYKGIVTFGGAWSNHIVASACACYLNNINCVGIIRGEKPSPLSPTLEESLKYNIKLKFVPREIYRQKSNDEFLITVKKEFPGYYVIPEGGAGQYGEKGAGEIMKVVHHNNYTHIVCAVGTGTMLKGISKTLSMHQQMIGIIVLKGWNEISETANAALFSEYHFGGYAKHTFELISFMNEFYSQTNIPTDFVYTGKLAFAVSDLIKKDQFMAGSKILMIHSGGLQGNRSLQKGSLIF